MTDYQITSQDLIFRGLHPSIHDKHQVLLDARLIQYANTAFFIWGYYDSEIKRLLENTKQNETAITEHINKLITSAMAYKSTLFPPEDYHLSTTRIHSKQESKLFTLRTNKTFVELNPAEVINHLGSLYYLLYDKPSPTLNERIMKKQFNLTPLLFRIGEIFWNLDQLYLCFQDASAYHEKQRDAIINAITEHFAYLGELYGYTKIFVTKISAQSSAETKRQLINKVKIIYTKYRKDNNIKHPTNKTEEERIINALKKLFFEQYGIPLNRQHRWFTNNIF